MYKYRHTCAINDLQLWHKDRRKLEKELLDMSMSAKRIAERLIMDSPTPPIDEETDNEGKLYCLCTMILNTGLLYSTIVAEDCLIHDIETRNT